MLKNNTSVTDDAGYNQGFRETPSQKKRIERRAGWMLQEMDAPVGKTVLEIGCGTGYLAYCMAQKTTMQIVSTDVNPTFIAEAEKKYKCSNLSYQTLDFKTAKEKIDVRFDYIIGNGILHHLYYDMDEVLLTLKKMLHPSGKMLFMEPNIYNPYIAAIFKHKKFRSWARLEPGEMAFSKKIIEEKLKKAGFENVNITYKDFLLPGIPNIFITPSIVIGNLLEKTPLKVISQSLFISAVTNQKG